jgi:serine/threonine-protein kinase
VFGSIAYVVKRRFDLREKQLEADNKVDRDQLEESENERKLLLGRIENLESIVCSVDYELNVRLNQLTTGQTGQQRALPAGEVAQVEPAEEKNNGGVAPGETAIDDKRRPAPAALPVPDALAFGNVVNDRYRIQRLLGQGGMGAVYLADDEVLGEPIALKVIATQWGGQRDELIERFRREASAARKVSSPHVIRIHDLGETRDGMLFISMEFFPGKPLSEIIDARGTLSEGDTRDIIGKVCSGLEAAHSASVIHRDLKPQNVLVGDQNAVKIIDFGLAKTGYMHGMTATGLIMGTPHYMSPEQVRGKEVDARSDIYSLGALTYHAVTGEPPFDGSTPIAIGFAHCSETPRPPRELRADVPKKLNAAIIAALAKNPADRPRTAAEFGRAL